MFFFKVSFYFVLAVKMALDGERDLTIYIDGLSVCVFLCPSVCVFLCPSVSHAQGRGNVWLIILPSTV